MKKTIIISTVLLCLLPASGESWRSGLTSWYTPKQSHVRCWGTQMLTASNEYRPGTRLQVQHGRRQIVVTVCGTGPFVRGRKLDLSRHAFIGALSTAEMRGQWLM